jgi:hypothetical protein
LATGPTASTGPTAGAPVVEVAIDAGQLQLIGSFDQAQRIAAVLALSGPVPSTKPRSLHPVGVDDRLLHAAAQAVLAEHPQRCGPGPVVANSDPALRVLATRCTGHDRAPGLIPEGGHAASGRILTRIKPF